MNALPLILFFLAVASLGYRYYSAFLAARVAALDDARVTPAHRFTDGNANPISNHMLDTLYMKHRVDFDEARAGRF